MLIYCTCMCTESSLYEANERCDSGNNTYACLLNSMLNLVWTCTVAEVIKKDMTITWLIWYVPWQMEGNTCENICSPRTQKSTKGSQAHAWLLGICRILHSAYTFPATWAILVQTRWSARLLISSWLSPNCRTWHIPLNWHTEIRLSFRFCILHLLCI